MLEKIIKGLKETGYKVDYYGLYEGETVVTLDDAVNLAHIIDK
ncbi:hypothetical protein [Lachnoclostridium sp.]|nr:hypothetical protein [Lachnoclostridium sp.]